MVAGDTTMDDPGGASFEDATGLAALLEHVREARGFDFTGYEQASLARGVHRRMKQVGSAGYHDYLDFLQVHPEELAPLLDTLLVNVTSFFRDPPAWDAMHAHIARIAASRPADAPIRVWSAGCASGEEAFTLAMILGECLGPAEVARRVKIFATDVDDAALVQARAATYTAHAVASIPPALLARWFTPSDRGYVVTPELRRAVIFGRHDLLRDAPIGRVDVLACRNTLIYFDAETQARLLARLQAALAPGGILFLGKAETLVGRGAPFTPLDLSLRIFTAHPRPGRHERPTPSRGSRRGGEDPPAPDDLMKAAFDALPHAVIALDVTGRIAGFNRQATRIFGLVPGDLRRPFQDLELSYRPTDLRSLIDLARAERRVVQREGLAHGAGPGHPVTCLDLEVVPLVVGDALAGTELCFRDATSMRRIEAEVRHAHRELAASHDALRTVNEQLATTNEELQSANDELLFANDALLSTSDELGTLNDELQSRNAELDARNVELGARGAALDEANVRLTSILGSLRAGVALLDRDLVVRSWNRAMTELWGGAEAAVVGRPFLDLDRGLPLAELEAPLRACLAGLPAEDRVVACVTCDGRAVVVRASVHALRGASERGVLVVLEETA